MLKVETEVEWRRRRRRPSCGATWEEPQPDGCQRTQVEAMSRVLCLHQDHPETRGLVNTLVTDYWCPGT